MKCFIQRELARQVGVGLGTVQSLGVRQDKLIWSSR
jgi:hypothetical protein